jgi:hypothetical protein
VLDAVEQAAVAEAPAMLRPVHRLDAGTSGVLVLARTAAFASWWSERQREGVAGADEDEEDENDERRRQRAAAPPAATSQQKKIYRCLSLDPPCSSASSSPPPPPPLGTHVHWAITRYRPLGSPASAAERTVLFATRAEAEAALARPGGAGRRAEVLLRRAGGNAAAVAPPTAKRCELAVLSARRVGGDGDAEALRQALSPRARDAFLPAAAGSDPVVVGGGWEALVELRTGRTHQIRAQMAALGWALAGDPLYGGGGGGGMGEDEKGGAAPADRPIALQAAELRVFDPEGRMGAETDGDGWARFAAGAPWWWAEEDDDDCGAAT